ncbi:PKD domain-containing protein [Pseudoalteromonas sp. T1lg65]|uniref:PKD domain-containing protein n=1 Tax=Pseudoalteromonas sp. T1lg65 TaxID=2077101 RepID=UPI003F79EAB4
MKAVTLMISAILTLGLTACGGSSSSSPKKDPPPKVDDGKVKSQPPVAKVNAVNDVEIGQTITLDGSSSSLPEGTMVLWLMLEKPESSKAQLSDTKTLQPSFTVDVAGKYEVQLLLTNGDKTSAANVSFTLEQSTENQQPTATFSADTTNLYPNEAVTFDASRSSDPDGDQLTYQWSVDTFRNNAEYSITEGNTVKATFSTATVGKYVVNLTVSDGTLTDTFSKTIDVTKSPLKPVIIAPSSAKIGDEVFLTAGNSTLNSNTELTWRLNNKPENSKVELHGSNTMALSFIPDVAGLYSVQLMLADEGGDFSTAIAEITVQNHETNSSPTAIIRNTATQSTTHEEVTLNGAASFDPDGDTLGYQWQVEAPEGARYTLTNTSEANATFMAETKGSYRFSLTVSDSELSHKATLTHRVVSGNTAPTASFSVLYPKEPLKPVRILKARGSDDENNTLIYRWSIEHQPDGSKASIKQLNHEHAELTFDASGIYKVQVVASDGQLESQPYTEELELEHETNQRPVVSKIIIPENIEIGVPITLEAIASDPEGAPLTFRWRVRSLSGGSYELKPSTTSKAELTIYKAGAYVVGVYASDGTLESRIPRSKGVRINE